MSVAELETNDMNVVYGSGPDVLDLIDVVGNGIKDSKRTPPRKKELLVN